MDPGLRQDDDTAMSNALMFGTPTTARPCPSFQRKLESLLLPSVLLLETKESQSQVKMDSGVR
jgi:hypothetical protein